MIATISFNIAIAVIAVIVIALTTYMYNAFANDDDLKLTPEVYYTMGTLVKGNQVTVFENIHLEGNKELLFINPNNKSVFEEVFNNPLDKVYEIYVFEGRVVNIIPIDEAEVERLRREY